MNSAVRFKVFISASTLNSLFVSLVLRPPLTPAYEPLNVGINVPHGIDFTLDLPVTTRCTPVSRNFYQYKSFTVKHDPDITLLEITPSSILGSCDYDPATNSITVTFKDYNSPYTGDVLSYTLVHREKGIRQRSIRIN